jgi:hypothetical protein
MTIPLFAALGGGDLAGSRDSIKLEETLPEAEVLRGC